ncbi:MAG: radical SAM family heme chaperone HemW [Cytophagaceae bacterium]|jgi:oxygen-independent coproporphyrinogen-3 oxidase|nr:radical SAM family heme chaperone HemW [Cytophagaceae bacterium]
MNTVGIYIHIPFCRHACHYCNFHFSTQLHNKPELIAALGKEIQMRSTFFDKNTLVQTLYFGGGTPSLLERKEWEYLIQQLQTHFTFASDVEWTIEVNPEDVTPVSLSFWKSIGVNRLSIGVQTLHAPALTFLNRHHTPNQSLQCMDWVIQAGFTNYSVDLIFGIPLVTTARLIEDIKTLTQYRVPHISAYALTIEPKTYFGHQVTKNKMQVPEEEFVAEQFEVVMDCLEASGYEQYEISNYALNRSYAQHNSSYWQDIPYLGVGPGAHSYDGQNRFSMIENNALYIRAIQSGSIPLTLEEMKPEDRYNDIILTSIRTKTGVSKSWIENRSDKERVQVLQSIDILLNEGFLIQNNDYYQLTRKGKLLADEITLKLLL